MQKIARSSRYAESQYFPRMTPQVAPCDRQPGYHRDREADPTERHDEKNALDGTANEHGRDRDNGVDYDIEAVGGDEPGAATQVVVRNGVEAEANQQRRKDKNETDIVFRSVEEPGEEASEYNQRYTRDGRGGEHNDECGWQIGLVRASFANGVSDEASSRVVCAKNCRRRQE